MGSAAGGAAWASRQATTNPRRKKIGYGRRGRGDAPRSASVAVLLRLHRGAAVSNVPSPEPLERTVGHCARARHVSHLPRDQLHGSIGLRRAEPCPSVSSRRIWVESSASTTTREPLAASRGGYAQPPDVSAGGQRAQLDVAGQGAGQGCSCDVPHWVLLHGWWVPQVVGRRGRVPHSAVTIRPGCAPPAAASVRGDLGRARPVGLISPTDRERLRAGAAPSR